MAVTNGIWKRCLLNRDATYCARFLLLVYISACRTWANLNVKPPILCEQTRSRKQRRIHDKKCDTDQNIRPPSQVVGGTDHTTPKKVSRLGMHLVLWRRASPSRGVVRAGGFDTCLGACCTLCAVSTSSRMARWLLPKPFFSLATHTSDFGGPTKNRGAKRPWATTHHAETKTRGNAPPEHEPRQHKKKPPTNYFLTSLGLYLKRTARAWHLAHIAKDKMKPVQGNLSTGRHFRKPSSTPSC